MNGFPFAFFGLLPDGETGQVLKKKSNASYDVEWGKGGGLSGESYTFVAADSADPTANGIALISAYNAAKSKTPYGNALSATNRYTILMGDGIYDTFTVFNIDTEFIDFKSITGNRVTFLQNLNITADDVKICDFDCGNNLIIVDYNLDDLYLRNLKSTNEDGGSFCIGGTFSGTAENCEGGFGSFGGDGGTASGTFINCICSGGSFGGGGTASGTFINCTCLGEGFGSYGTASGIFINCIGESASFGGSGTSASGVFKNCMAGGNGFGGGSAILTGKLINCQITYGTFQTVSGAGRTYFCIDGNGDINNQ